VAAGDVAAGAPAGGVDAPRPASPVGTGATPIAGAAALIAILTVASRVAGFGRTAVLGWTVEDTRLGAIYLAVNAIPNVIFEIVAGGALAGLVVPVLAGAAEARDRATVSATASALLTWTLSLLVPLSVAVAVLAEPIAAAVTGVSGAELDTATLMLRVFAPQLALYGVGIVLAGVLQAHHRFAWPVIAPLLSSVTVIAAYLTFAAVAGRGSDIGEVSLAGVLILAVGTTLGVVVLSLCLVVPVRGLRLTWRPTYAFHPGTARAVRGLAVAGAVTLTAQQLALLVTMRLSFAVPGEATFLYVQFAQTVYLLPWAVLAVPVATAAYPGLSAAWSGRDHDRYAGTLAPAARAVLLLSCLGAAALVAVAEPAAQVLLDPPGTGPLAAAIAGMAPGLLGYALFALLSRALYARGATRAAAAAAAAGWAVAALAALGFALSLSADRRALALALGNSAGMLVLGVVLVVVVARLAGRRSLAGLGRVAAVGLLAGACAALAGLAAGRAVAAVLDGTPAEAVAVVQGMLSGGLAAVVFVAVAYPLDRHDLRPLLARVRRRRAERDGDAEGGGR
jgi:putative peptidoglycan lipid II flippase